MKTIFQLKKILIISQLFLVGNVCLGQEKSILFNEITHHIENGNFKNNIIDLFSEKKQVLKNRDKYLTLNIDSQKIESIIEQSETFISLKIPISETENKLLYLKKRALLQDNFKLIVETNNGAIDRLMPKYAAYTGIVVDEKENSIAAITFVNNTMRGIISIGNKEYTIAPKNDDDGEIEYLIYEKSDVELPLNNFTCGTRDEDISSHEIQYRNASQSTIPKCVTLHFEINKKLKDETGGINQNIIVFLNTFNIVQTKFANDNITVRTSFLKIWETDDPYYQSFYGVPGEPGSFQDLGYDSFVQNCGQINGNIGILLSNYFSNIGGLGGGIPCANQGFCTVRLFESKTIMHEIGHVLGSRHTHWCGWPGGAIDNCYATEGGCNPGPPPVNGGTIMSYCFSQNILDNGFGLLPLGVIQNSINNSSCISSCDSSITCLDNIVNLQSISNTTVNSFTINWSSIYPVKVYFKESNSTNYTLLSTINNPVNSYEIFFTPSTNCTIQKFEIKLVAVCPNGDSKPSVIVYSPQRHLEPYLGTNNYAVYLCNIPEPTFAYLPIVGNNLKFYANENDLTPLPTSTILPLNTYITYYVSQTIDGCESSKAKALYIIVNTNVTPPTAENTQTFYCTNPSVADLQVDNLQNTVWWDSITGGNAYFGAEPIINNQYYYAENQNYSPTFCASNRLPVLALKSTATPTAYSIPFTETFNKSICALGYGIGSAASSGDIVDNVLKIPNFNFNVNDDFVTTKKINLTAGTTYYISFKVRKIITNQNATIISEIFSSSNYFELGTFSTVSDAYSTVNYTVTPTVSGQFYIRLKVYAAQSDGVYIDDLNVSTTLGFNEIEKENFIIYPNPTKNLIKIQSKTNTINSIEIYDIQGRIIKKEIVNDTNYTINVEEVSNGTYLLKIYSEKQNKTFKIIKN